MDSMYLQQVIWITGLSGSGKTTTARILSKVLTGRGFKVIHLDGDELRAALINIDTMGSYDKASRLKNSYIYASLASSFAQQADFVIVSTISMFEELYRSNRRNIEKYFEVFLDVPEEIRKIRDKKNIYLAVDGEKSKDVCGVNLGVDIPKLSNFKYEFKESDKPQDVSSKVILALESWCPIA